MRELITGLAIILIAVLTTALVGPYFVDWNSQRTLLETQLSHTLGQKVTIGGNIDLKLLPTPYLVLSQTVIGSDDGAVTIGIRHLDLELSVAPLLHGEFDVVEALLEEPTIRVSLQQGRTLPALPDAPAFKANIRFDKIHVTDGTLAVADSQSGRTFILDKLDLDAEAPSLSGPFKAGGSFGEGEAQTKFRLSTTTFHADRSRVRLLVDETLQHAGFDLDGELSLKEVQKDVLRQSFAGTFLTTGHLWSAAGTATPWRLSGPLKADPNSAQLDGAALRIGSEDAGVSLKADISGDFVATIQAFTPNISAKQLDVDRLSGTPLDTAKPAPPKLPDLASLRRLLASISPPLPTTLDLSIESATCGGAALDNLAAHLVIGGTGPEKVQASSDGPGGTHISLSGTLDAAADHPFTGSVDLSAEKLSQTLDWLASIEPDMTLKSEDLPIEAFALHGRVNIGQDRIDFGNLSLDIDRSHLAGTANLAFGGGSGASKLTAVLQAKSLDVDRLPTFSAIHDFALPVDLDVQLAADSLRVNTLGSGGLNVGRVEIALRKTGGALDLKRFSAHDLGGATIEATGHLDSGTATVAMHVAASKLDHAAALLKQLAPTAIETSVPKNVAALAPARFKLDATFAVAGAKPHPTRLLLAGQFGATKVDASLVPDPNLADAVSLDATIETPQGSALLRQFGSAADAGETIGRTRIILSAHGALNQPLEASVQASLGATRVDFQGQATLSDLASPAGSGVLTLRSADAGPLLRSFAAAYPGSNGPLPVNLRSDLVLDRTSSTFSNIDGSVDHDDVKGTLAWRAANSDKPSVTGSLSLERLKLSSLLGLALGPSHPLIPGSNWSNVSFAPAPADLPKTFVSVKYGALELPDNLIAREGGLGLEPGAWPCKDPGSEGRVERRLHHRRPVGTKGWPAGSRRRPAARRERADRRSEPEGKALGAPRHGRRRPVTSGACLQPRRQWHGHLAGHRHSRC